MKETVHDLTQKRANPYSDCHAPALSALFSRKRMWFTKVRAPITSSNGNNTKLGDDDSSADSGSDFF